jgi:DNA-binding transcriptional LysR family regulator
MNIANFDLNLLRVFDALMTERNVTRAAQIVFLSQPAVSHALSRLRNELGDPLFVRAGRTMMPTEKAISLHAAVRTVLDQLTAALGESRFDAKTSTAIFRVGTLDVGDFIFAPLFARLMKDAPHVRFVIQTFDDANYPSQLASGELDFVITMAVARGPGIHAKRLGTYPLVAVARNGHELTRGRVTPRRFMELPRLAIMARADRLDSQADRLLGEARIGGKVVYATPHHAAAPVLLMNSDLLMVTTEILAKIMCAQFPLTIVQLPVQLPPVESHMIWHERTHHDSAQQWLRGEIVQHTAELTEEAARKR